MSKAPMYKAIKKSSHWISLTSLLILMATGLPSALSTNLDKTEAIKIKADYMAFNLETGKNTYKGNVSITQGSIELTGDKVIILRSNDKVSDINVTGSPARYIQDENTKNIVRAMSQQIHYSSQNSRLVLTKKASLEQADHTVESERITYDTAKKMIIAGSTSTGKNPKKNGAQQRVNITLTPQKDMQEK